MPLRCIPGSRLCPVKAVSVMLDNRKYLCHKGELPLFSYMSSNNMCCLTHTTFVSMLKSTLTKIHVNATLYSGHSFHRGVCFYAFQLGIPPLLIKLCGNLKSNAYKRYVSIDDKLHVQIASMLSIAAL